MDYGGSPNSTMLVRVFLLITMLSFFIGSIFMVIEGQKNDVDQANKKWFGVAQIVWVLLLFIAYVAKLVLF
jgi:hypothetical protein